MLPDGWIADRNQTGSNSHFRSAVRNDGRQTWQGYPLDGGRCNPCPYSPSPPCIRTCRDTVLWISFNGLPRVRLFTCAGSDVAVCSQTGSYQGARDCIFTYLLGAESGAYVVQGASREHSGGGQRFRQPVFFSGLFSRGRSGLRKRLGSRG